MSDAAEDIMCATHRALCEHGYADLTMQAIADESDRSKAALHYHFDTKRDLLVAFLDHLQGRLAERLATLDGATPRERLLALIDELLAEPRGTEAFDTAKLEIKAQAPYDRRFREQIADIDDLIHERVRREVAAGIESGQFRADADPDAVATFVLTVLDGAHTRRVTAGESPDAVAATLKEYVETDLHRGATAE
jgi:AcrR family transcriptional regulator